ncbi:hypothetical protein ACQ4PT_068230 [Festuca glaucescens]
MGGFVTHRGWNSVPEGMWFGVLMVPWPLYAEQHLNAFTLVAYMGAAVAMKTTCREGRELPPWGWLGDRHGTGSPPLSRDLAVPHCDATATPVFAVSGGPPVHARKVGGQKGNQAGKMWRSGEPTPPAWLRFRTPCWAFLEVGAVEGINKIVTGDLVTLSEQELMECARNGRNNGCNGGTMDDTFDFFAGIDTEEDYPWYPPAPFPPRIGKRRYTCG